MDDRGVRWEVDEGSKPFREGVTRALRFWVIESSMLDREVRRKAGCCGRGEVSKESRDEERVYLEAQGEFHWRSGIGSPRNVPCEKQNCGVKCGGFVGCAMMSRSARFGWAAVPAGRVADSDFQKIPARVTERSRQ